MSYCSLGKKNLIYKEIDETPFFALTLYYREYFTPFRDALTTVNCPLT